MSEANGREGKAGSQKWEAPSSPWPGAWSGWFSELRLLGRFLRDAGCINIQRRPQIIDWSAGTEEHKPMFQDLRMFIKLLQPFIIEVGVLTQEESDRLYREAELEMMSDDFCALLNFLTVWGEKPKP